MVNFSFLWQICEQFIGETLAIETASEAMQVCGYVVVQIFLWFKKI